MPDLRSGKNEDDWPERSIRFWVDRTMPRFWPPRPSRFWGTVLTALRRRYARGSWRVSDIEIEGMPEALNHFGPCDGVILSPNHSHEGDAHVMLEVGRRARKRLYFMVAWQAFRRHWGFDGWLLQRMGCFSVDREGADRRAVRQAIDLLSAGNWVVIFPEGEIHHLNERLMPLLDGVAFMACQAQRELARAEDDARVWILPVGIRYRFADDIRPQLEATIERLEKRMFWWKQGEAPLHERIIRLGEMLLTIKEKEKLGRSGEADGDLPTRIFKLIDTLLASHEEEFLGKNSIDKTVPMRVKALRRQLLERGAAEDADEETWRKVLRGLDDVQLALQLYSYPGDYVQEEPTPERMAETLEKFEEDIYGTTRSIGTRCAHVRFGTPIDMREECQSGRTRAVIARATDSLEESLGGLLTRT